MTPPHLPPAVRQQPPPVLSRRAAPLAEPAVSPAIPELLQARGFPRAPPGQRLPQVMADDGAAGPHDWYSRNRGMRTPRPHSQPRDGPTCSWVPGSSLRGN